MLLMPNSSKVIQIGFRTMATELRRSSRTQASAIATESNTSSSSTSRKRSRENIVDRSEVVSGQPAGTVSMLPPATPVKRQRMNSRNVPPLTPTPSAIGVMLEQTADSSRPGESANIRVVQPHQTNALLVTPRGTQIRNGETTARQTTSTLLHDACQHLITVDPELKPLVDRHHCRVFSEEGLAEEIDPFNALVSGILSQQVSGAAAKSIKNKFIALFTAEQCPNGFPKPSVVAVTELSLLRTAGLSQRKAEYVQGLAQKFASNELTVDMLMNGSDEEVMEKLVAVRGLGIWSVQMFMCFALKRMDILSTGDLGVQRGMAVYVGKDVSKLKNKGGKWKYMSEQDMLSISEKFSPYRSLFMWYMWRIEDVVTDAME